MVLDALLQFFEPRTYIVIYLRRNMVCNCYLFELNMELTKKNDMGLLSYFVKMAFIENDTLNIILKDVTED